MASRESRGLTGMKPVGGRACAIRNLCPLPSRPWMAVFPFSGGSSVLLCVWKGFFLEPEGVVSSWGDSFLLPFPAHPRYAGGGSSPSTWPVSRAAVFTPQLPRSACANKQFLTLSYLCPNVCELHWDVYICLPEEPRK